MNIDPSNSGYNPANIQQSQVTQQVKKVDKAATQGAGAPQADLNVSDLERVQSYVDRLKDMSAVRPEKVEAAKEALSNGDYASDEAIDTTASRLLDELNGL